MLLNPADAFFEAHLVDAKLVGKVDRKPSASGRAKRHSLCHILSAAGGAPTFMLDTPPGILASKLPVAALLPALLREAQNRGFDVTVLIVAASGDESHAEPFALTHPELAGFRKIVVRTFADLGAGSTSDVCGLPTVDLGRLPTGLMAYVGIKRRHFLAATWDGGKDYGTAQRHVGNWVRNFVVQMNDHGLFIPAAKFFPDHWLLKLDLDEWDLDKMVTLDDVTDEALRQNKLNKSMSRLVRDAGVI
jgi:hypothetical protein